MLCEREKYWIEYYRSYISEIGYNSTKGGDGGALTGEALEKMKKSKTGQKQTEEQIRKRVTAFKEKGCNIGEKNGMYGKTPWNKGIHIEYTPEQKENHKKATIEGMKKSTKYQQYLERLEKTREEYFKTPKYCPICNNPLSWERHLLVTCGSEKCKREIQKKR